MAYNAADAGFCVSLPYRREHIHKIRRTDSIASLSISPREAQTQVFVALHLVAPPQL